MAEGWDDIFTEFLEVRRTSCRIAGFHHCRPPMQIHSYLQRPGVILVAIATFAWAATTGHCADGDGLLRVLFLGDNGHHRPAERFRQLQPVLAPKGIELEYTERLEDLHPAKLAGF